MFTEWMKKHKEDVIFTAAVMAVITLCTLAMSCGSSKIAPVPFEGAEAGFVDDAGNVDGGEEDGGYPDAGGMDAGEVVLSDSGTPDAGECKPGKGLGDKNHVHCQ